MIKSMGDNLGSTQPMKIFRKVLLMCTFIGGLVGVSTALAVEDKGAAAALKKDVICTECHDETEPRPILFLYQNKHGIRADSNAPTCQACHGESEKHWKKPPPKDKAEKKLDVLFGTKRGTSGTYPPSSADVQNTACLSCHKKDSKRMHWEGSAHQSHDISCASCHEIHTLRDKVMDKRTQAEVCFNCHKEQRAQVDRPSHHPIPEGKMTCTDCHNAHGSVGPKLMKRDSTNETCYTCHMEKRGPFAHNHEPVDDDCSICHNPHGTTAESMLKMRAPFLCHTCHAPHGPVQPLLAGQVPAPGIVTWASGAAITQGRACMNCHTQVHGSNNPSSADPANAQFLFR